MVWAVNAGGGEYTSSDGIVYAADEGFSGGSTSTTFDTINATPDAPLYQTERWGSNFAYAATIPNGRYSVTFRLAEIYWLSANQRKFSIAVEGQSRLGSIDIVQEKATGAFAAYDLSVGNVVVADGQINIDFSSIVDAAKISAIVVRRQGDSSSDWQLVWQDEFNVDGPIDDS